MARFVIRKSNLELPTKGNYRSAENIVGTYSYYHLDGKEVASVQVDSNSIWTKEYDEILKQFYDLCKNCHTCESKYNGKKFVHADVLALIYEEDDTGEIDFRIGYAEPYIGSDLKDELTSLLEQAEKKAWNYKNSKLILAKNYKTDTFELIETTAGNRVWWPDYTELYSACHQNDDAIECSGINMEDYDSKEDAMEDAIYFLSDMACAYDRYYDLADTIIEELKKENDR